MIYYQIKIKNLNNIIDLEIILKKIILSNTQIQFWFPL
jgi:hypothetical protein